MSTEFEVLFNPSVGTDIQRAVDFYSGTSQNPELGSRFLAATTDALSRLKASALQYQVRYSDIRLLPVAGFPFHIHYRVSVEQRLVFVEAVFHMKLSPEQWTTRMRS